MPLYFEDLHAILAFGLILSPLLIKNKTILRWLVWYYILLLLIWGFFIECPLSSVDKSDPEMTSDIVKFMFKHQLVNDRNKIKYIRFWTVIGFLFALFVASVKLNLNASYTLSFILINLYVHYKREFDVN